MRHLTLWRTLGVITARWGGRATIERRQRRRLRRLVEFARTHSDFYRDLYAAQSGGSTAQSGSYAAQSGGSTAKTNRAQFGGVLASLPVVTKPQLMQCFDEWLTDPAVTRTKVEEHIRQPELIGTELNERYLIFTTSGTTGKPGIFLHDHHCTGVYRALALGRITPAWFSPAKLVRFVARGMKWASVVGSGGHFAGVGWMAHEAKRLGRLNQYATVSVEQPLSETVAQLNSYQPAILAGYPSALDQLAREQLAGRLTIAPLVVEAGGENFLPDARKRISTAFNVQAKDVYATSEFQMIACDCAHGRLHVNEDWLILEPVDANFQPVDYGHVSHTVLLTHLANYAQPLIRYDLGDSVRIVPEKCVCGSPFAVIEIHGRDNDVLEFKSASGMPVEIAPLALTSALEVTPNLEQFQVVQTSPTSLLIRFVPLDHATVEAVHHELTERVTTFLAGLNLTQIQLDIKCERPEQVGASGKLKQVIKR